MNRQFRNTCGVIILALLIVLWNANVAIQSDSHVVIDVQSVKQEEAVIVGSFDVTEHAHVAEEAVVVETIPAAGSFPPARSLSASSPTLAWTPLAMQYSGGVFGSVIAAPIASAQDPWCAIELLDIPTSADPVQYNPTCREDRLRQGNFSRMEDFMAFRSLPRNNPFGYLLVTEEERQLYWRDNSDPFIANCRACEDNLAHKTLYRARRWWRMRAWRRYEPSAGGEGGWVRLYGSFLGAHDRFFSTRRGSISTSGFDLEPVDPNLDIQIPYADVHTLYFCDAPDDAYVEIHMKNGSQFVMQPQLFHRGTQCMWRSLQLLFPDSLAILAKSHSPQSCSFGNRISKKMVMNDNYFSKATPTQATVEFPFTPCYRNDITNLSNIIREMGTLGSRKNYWPFTCDAFRDTRACGQEKAIQLKSRGVRQDIKVAVTLAGFIRSFAISKKYIYENMVRPHGATLFGVTWNVVGRTKKTTVVTKKMTVKPHIMFNTFAPVFGISSNDTFKKFEVLDYFRYFRQHEALRANGLLHPGLYYTLSRSLQLVYESRVLFDVVIRSRFDIHAAVPLHFARLQPSSSTSSHEFAIDLGSSCQMDDMWWPQYARFGAGRVLKHYADTRMKFFSWQVCDWIDIGTYETMRNFTTMFDWMVENNIHSAAQFVDHAFFIDRNLTYLPLQLYLKIHRHKGVLFG